MSSCGQEGVHQRALQGQGRPGAGASLACSTGSTEAVSLGEAVARAAGWSAASGRCVGPHRCGKDSAGPRSDGDTAEGDPALPGTLNSTLQHRSPPLLLVLPTPASARPSPPPTLSCPHCGGKHSSAQAPSLWPEPACVHLSLTAPSHRLSPTARALPSTPCPPARP